MLRIPQALRHFGKLAQSFVQPQPRIPRHQCNTHFLGTNWSHVELASRPPVELHKLGPGRNSVVPAECEPLFFLSMNVEPGPAPYSGTAAVCANGPARGDEFALHQHAVGMKSRDHCAPKKSHTSSFRMFHHEAMESGAAHPESGSIGERSFGGQSGTDKTNSAEPMRLGQRDAHAELLQRGDAVGHKPLTAGLVDRRPASVRDRDFEP